MDHPSPPPLPSARPVLWNPNAAANWSILLTPIFGAYLHHRNWLALGQPGKAAASLKWCFLSCAFLVAFCSVPFEQMPYTQITKRLPLILLVIWYFVSAKEQVRYVKEQHPEGYEKKKWGMTLLKGLGVVLVLVFVAVTINLTLEAFGVWGTVE